MFDNPFSGVPLLSRTTAFPRRIASGPFHGPSVTRPSATTGRCPSPTRGEAAAITRPSPNMPPFQPGQRRLELVQIVDADRVCRGNVTSAGRAGAGPWVWSFRWVTRCSTGPTCMVRSRAASTAVVEDRRIGDIIAGNRGRRMPSAAPRTMASGRGSRPENLEGEREWCARQDSNLRPLAPEANALSS